MITYQDRTFCISEACINECGRKLTQEIMDAANKAGMYVAVGKFCEPKETGEIDDSESSEE